MFLNKKCLLFLNANNYSLCFLWGNNFWIYYLIQICKPILFAKRNLFAKKIEKRKINKKKKNTTSISAKIQCISWKLFSSWANRISIFSGIAFMLNWILYKCPAKVTLYLRRLRKSLQLYFYKNHYYRLLGTCFDIYDIYNCFTNKY